MGRGHWVTDTCGTRPNFDPLKLTKLLSCGVQSVSSFQCPTRCFVGKTRDFPDIDTNTDK